MKFAVIGNPIEHSLSPALHNWVFRELGIDAEYLKIKVSKEDLSKIPASLRNGELQGINVTIPHKQEIVPLLDEFDDHAQTMGTVNCVSTLGGRLKGYNTDWLGFSKAIKANGVSVRGKDCLILGAGGAAQAVVYALTLSKPASITIANRTLEKAHALAKWITHLSPVVSTNTSTIEQLETSKDIDLIVNCTPLGMTPHSDTSPLPSHFIHNDHTLVDTVYTPLLTKFLLYGKEVGAHTVSGLDMFIFQGLATLDLWLEEPISQKVDVDELSTYLEQELMEESMV